MADKLNYQKLSKELDDIVDKLQSGELDFDESIAQYEKGAKVIQQIESYLKTAKNKINKVKKSAK